MNRIFTIAILLIFNSLASAKAQQPLHHDKKIFTAPDGKMYINKSLPIYLRLSTSPEEGAESHLLKSEETHQYSNPMYLDTEGINTLRSPSCMDTVTKQVVYPEKDIIFEIYADSYAPTTKIDYGKVLTIFKDGKTMCGGVTEITLEAKDQLSGVENIYFSLDGSGYTPYSGTIKLNQEKEYLLKFYAVDNVGNVEKVKEKVILVDDSNPSTKLEVKGDLYNDIISGRSSIELKTADKHGIKGIYYSLDGKPEKIYNDPISGAYLTQGEHTLEYYSVDILGNKEEIKNYKFYVDKTPPTIVEEIIGNSYVANGREYSSGRSQLKLTTIDNKAGVKEIYYSINSGEYQLYEKPFFLTKTPGNIFIRSYALDNVNNKGTSMQSSDATSIPYIDLSGPKITCSFIGSYYKYKDTVFISSETKIKLKANDTESGANRIEYSINKNKFIQYESPFSLSETGINLLECVGYDNVDNINKETFICVVDNKGPEIFHRFSMNSANIKKQDNENIKVFPRHTVLFLSSTDDYVGYDRMFYSINGMTEKECFGSINQLNSENIYKIKVRALDKLGNQTEDLIHFYME